MDTYKIIIIAAVAVVFVLLLVLFFKNKKSNKHNKAEKDIDKDDLKGSTELLEDEFETTVELKSSGVFSIIEEITYIESKEIIL